MEAVILKKTKKKKKLIYIPKEIIIIIYSFLFKNLKFDYKFNETLEKLNFKNLSSELLKLFENENNKMIQNFDNQWKNYISKLRCF